MYHCSRDATPRVKAQRLSSQCYQRPEFVGGVISQEDARALCRQQPGNFPRHEVQQPREVTLSIELLT